MNLRLLHTKFKFKGFMNILKKLNTIYKTVKYRNKIANINTNDLILENFESVCAFYKGFFGEPQIDNNLLTAYKNTSVKTNICIKDCTDSIGRKGWELIYTKTNDGLYMKILMVPGYDIKNYLNQKALGNGYIDIISLYKKLGGNVI